MGDHYYDEEKQEWIDQDELYTWDDEEEDEFVKSVVEKKVANPLDKS